jgi:hypothetical protein
MGEEISAHPPVRERLEVIAAYRMFLLPGNRSDFNRYPRQPVPQ